MTTPISILIVDDDFINRRVLEGMIRYMGQKAVPAPEFVISQADGGRPALAMLAGQCFDMICLDLMMPDIDGFGVLESMRLSANRTPVIIFTAASSDITRRVPASQVVSILSKPVSHDLLRTSMSVALGDRLGTGWASARFRYESNPGF
jgi:CheY-like chemotaxis protein